MTTFFPPKDDYSNAILRASPLSFQEEYPAGSLPAALQFDSLVLEKQNRRLKAYSQGVLRRVYMVALGTEPDGNKQRLNDTRTPEGTYSIVSKKSGTFYYKECTLSFPDHEDLSRLQSRNNDVVKPVLIHGLPESCAFLGIAHRVSDWTDGSIAISNQEIDEFFHHTPTGISIIIQP